MSPLLAFGGHAAGVQRSARCPLSAIAASQDATPVRIACSVVISLMAGSRARTNALTADHGTSPVDPRDVFRAGGFGAGDKREEGDRAGKDDASRQSSEDARVPEVGRTAEE